MKYIKLYENFTEKSIEVMPENPYKNDSCVELEEEYHKQLGKTGELSKHLKEVHGKSFTFGMLKAIYDDALSYKRKREFKKAGFKLVHRVIPIVTSFVFLPLAIINEIFGASRAFDKLLYPILNDPENNYKDFTKKLLATAIEIAEGDYRRFMDKDWFYDILRIDDGLKKLIRKEHFVTFVSYLSKKMTEENPEKEVPKKYVQNELKSWIK